MHPFTSIFEQSQETQKILGIRMYDDEDSFFVGQIVQFNAHIVQFHSFNTYGEWDGIYVQQIAQIENIDTDNDYLRACAYLMQQGKHTAKDGVTLSFGEGEEWQKEYLLQALAKNVMIGMDLRVEYGLSGWVTEVGETGFTLQGISKMGEDEGMSVYRWEDITALNWGNKRLQCMKTLYTWRKQ